MYVTHPTPFFIDNTKSQIIPASEFDTEEARIDSQLKGTAHSLSLFSKAKNMILTLFKVTSMTVSISALDLKLTPLITRFAIKQLGLCLNTIPSQATSLLSYIVSPLVKFNDSLGRLFGENISGKILIPAALEELEFRWLLQDVILRKIPEKILQCIAPRYVPLVDSTAARISRIALTALTFAVCHLHTLDCSGGGGMGPLVGGLLYGYVYEYTNWSLIGCMNLHGIYNMLATSKFI